MHKWFAEKGFYFDARSNGTVNQGEDKLIKKYIIFIEREKDPGNAMHFMYTIRGIISNEPVNYNGVEIMKELYEETSIDLPPKKKSTMDMNIVNVLNINDVLNSFVVRLNLNRSRYSALSSSNSNRF